MKPSDIQPIPIEELGHLFYELEFSAKDKKHEILRNISTLVPWQHSILSAIDNLKDPILRSSSRNYARLIQTERTYHRYMQIASRPLSRNYEDLEEGVFLLSELGDPNASYLELKEYLDRVANRIEDLFRENHLILSDEAKVQILIRVLVEEEGLSGDQDRYDLPENSYLSQVIRTKIGIPISLSVIYILVGKRLGLPLYGTNMPFHFLLFYDSPDYTTYIDPFHGGVLLDRNTCEKFLESHGFDPTQKYFARTSTSSILKRMFRNLINIYRKTGWKEMEELLSIYQQVLDKKRF
ncbi:transglutaminase-like domain-containing protein [Leptospira sp. GIMC2001]|uniref:transglutaminase-like domain-containing protein n=1 Tax=Leptospira sp. GIMC2001 TaxID=1513297 RepID=UPI00234BF27F|nr:transglutaminase-like domain-containing protein [Leptospira sp. GIMC2001]WCL49860.1 transglutaminase-like domain-containing protein [Leptospira sp. GIMC2001]